MEETFESLLEYCTADKRVCPNPRQWAGFSAGLSRHHEGATGEGPPCPWILSAWYSVPNYFKAQRLREQIEWARDHGLLAEAGAMLRRLSESDWHHLDCREPWRESKPTGIERGLQIADGMKPKDEDDED